jgi:peptidyl-prolyl cis-trans isomerase SurA
MRNYFLSAFCLLFIVKFSFCQTLFTYGNDSVSVNEFAEAYKKNSAPSNANKQKAILEYLDLYINAKLKIKEARSRGYDTLPDFVGEIGQMRMQLMPAYLNDPEGMNRLTNEAFVRLQKDIHLGHIFISFNQNGTTDTSAALKKAREAYTKVQKGENFSEVAKKYSDDPSVPQNGGDVGYITVFTLPYELENLAYSTATGKISMLYKSKSGFHIFKNVGERKAAGEIKAAQILFSVLPGADEATKARRKRLADSVYNRLVKGDNFEKMVELYSDDYVSAASKGVMPEFGVGDFDPVFEKNVFALQKPGSFTKPFLTAHGYHIVKLISRTPVNANKNNATAIQTLQQQIENSDRMDAIQSEFIKRVINQVGYKRSAFKEADLWAYTDSVLGVRNALTPVNVNSNTILFTIVGNQKTAGDWIQFTQLNRYKPDGSGVKTYNELWDEFVHASALDIYKNNLENVNKNFARQLNEVRDGNLFFDIMQREIWSPSQTDSAALMRYYEQHRSKYKWNKSADAIIFQAPDTSTARVIIQDINKTPMQWNLIVNYYKDRIAIDSGRFELTEIPNGVTTQVKAGAITKPLINKVDNSASFAYIIRVYDQPAQRSFSEAKGLVISDYQAELEKKWIEELRKKYPVKINEKALAGLLIPK